MKQPFSQRTHRSTPGIVLLGTLLLSISTFTAVRSASAQSQTDSDTAVEEIEGAAFEKATGLATDGTSLALQAAEDVLKYGTETVIKDPEMITGPLGAFAAAFSESSTADPRLDEVDPPASPDDSNYYLPKLTPNEQVQQNQLYQQIWRNTVNSAGSRQQGPAIQTNCGGCRVVH